MTQTRLFVVEKEYATSRLKGDHKPGFTWIDERVFSENDTHVDAETREQIGAEEAARLELARLRDAEMPEYIRGYRLIERVVSTRDRVLKA